MRQSDLLRPIEPTPLDVESQISLAIDFWDQTEGLLKRAEQINGEMVGPAVSELRYAGRKLIDFVRETSTSADPDKRRTHLEDFLQCCVRARHDAVDATFSYIMLYLEELESRVDADLISSQFSEYKLLKRDLKHVRNKISASRSDRDNRNKIYEDIVVFAMDKTIDTFEELRASEASLFEAQVKRNRTRHIVGWAVFGGLALFAVAIFALAVALAT